MRCNLPNFNTWNRSIAHSLRNTISARFPLCPWLLRISGSLLVHQTQNKCHSLAFKVFCPLSPGLPRQPGYLRPKLPGLAGSSPTAPPHLGSLAYAWNTLSSPSSPSNPIISFKTHKAPGSSSWPAPMSTFLSISPYSVELPWVIKPFFGQHFLSPFCVLGTGISALHIILLLCSPLQETSSKKLFILASQLLSPRALLNQLQTDPCPHLSAEIVLFKVTDDFYAAKSNDHFPILFLVDLSTGFVASIGLYHILLCWVSFT